MPNQDLFRATIDSLDRGALIDAMKWARSEGPLPFPKSIHWDLTLRCTARCTHCMQWSWPDQDEMAADQLPAFFATFRRWGVTTLTLGGGNPLLYPHLSRVLQLARESAIAVGMISEGGVVLDPALVEDLGRTLSWIRFSLDGPTPDVHDAIRSTPGLFASTTTMIAELHEKAPDLPIGINCVIQRQNLPHLAEMRELAAGLGVSVLLFKLPHGRDSQHRYVPTAQEWPQVLDWVRAESSGPDGDRGGVATNLAELSALLGRSLPIADLADGRPVRSYYAGRQARCYVPLFFLVCDSRGDVYPCDYLQADTRPWKGEYQRIRDEFRLGNVLADGDQVLARLDVLLRERVHRLPGDGYEECGSCTRFFQLNSDATTLEDSLRRQALSQEMVATAGRNSAAHGPRFL